MPLDSHRRQIVTATLAFVAVLASMGACDELLAPCKEVRTGGGMFGPDTYGQDPAKFLDVTWHLSTVDGKALPFTLPAGAGKLTKGEIDFNTFYLDAGKCEDPKKSRGQIIALYTIEGKKSETQAGSFDFDNTSSEVTLRALGESITAKVESSQFGPTLVRMVLNAPIPVAGGLVTVNYTLVFFRG